MKIHLIFTVLMLVTSRVKGLSEEVQDLSEEFWKWRLLDMPEYATFVGIHDYDDMLDDVSESAQINRVYKCKEFLRQVASLEPELTDDSDIITIGVLRYELETFISGNDFKGFYLPMNYFEGPHVDMESQFGWMLRDTEEDYKKMISRLEKLALRVDQTIELMTAGVKAGITNYNISMKGIPSSLSRFVVSDPSESPFYEYFASGFPTTFTPEQIETLQDQAKTVIDEQVTPAYEKLRSYVVNEYVTRSDIAATSMPNGIEYYDSLIWYHTSTHETAQNIHEIGLDEVERIEAEMLQVVIELGHSNMTVQEFSAMIRDDPANYYNTSDDFITAFEDVSYNRIPPHLGEIFKNIPSTKLVLKARPSESAPAAFYLSASYDGSRPGVFYLNTYDLSTQPKYEMLSLSLHEGNPGHHFQGSHSIENPDIPYFRRVVEDRNYGIAPSRFPIYSFYGEGWALYSERLGFDMNLYGNPLERYGHYSEEIFRACRLVVDTGIHALQWTREEAIEYMFAHTASSRGNIENEIDRYITWPGQALAYKMGERKFEELRSIANSTLGDLFDLKEFHEIVLNSVGPMTIVEQQVNKWMENLAF